MITTKPKRLTSDLSGSPLPDWYDRKCDLNSLGLFLDEYKRLGGKAFKPFDTWLREDMGIVPQNQYGEINYRHYRMVRSALDPTKWERFYTTDSLDELLDSNLNDGADSTVSDFHEDRIQPLQPYDGGKRHKPRSKPRVDPLSASPEAGAPAEDDLAALAGVGAA